MKLNEFIDMINDEEDIVKEAISPAMIGSLARKGAKGSFSNIKGAVPWVLGLGAATHIMRPPHVSTDTPKTKVKRFAKETGRFAAGFGAMKLTEKPAAKLMRKMLRGPQNRQLAKVIAAQRAKLGKPKLSLMQKLRLAKKPARASGLSLARAGLKASRKARVLRRLGKAGKFALPLAAGWAAWDLSDRLSQKIPFMRSKEEKIIPLRDLR